MLKKNVLPALDLQLFADGDVAGGAAGGASGGAGGASGGSGGTGGTSSESGASGGSGGEGETKTYTQKELNSMMAREKEQGRRSVLADLGIEDAKSGREGVAKYKEWLNTQKSDLDKATEAAAAAEKAKHEAEEKAVALERKLEALKLGCNPDFVDDVILLAARKVTDKKSFEAVVKEMQESHPMYFGGAEAENGGTGGGANGYRKPKGGTGTSLAADLAKKNTAGKIDSTKFF